MNENLITSTEITLLLIDNLNKLRLDIRKYYKNDIESSILDTLIFKLCNSSYSFCCIYKSENLTKQEHFKDIGTLYTISRSIIENFLTIEYLFFNKSSVQEKEFRLQLWILSGILSRHKDHQNAPIEYREKLDKEIEEFEKLKKEFINLEYFQSLDSKVKKKIRKQLTLFGSSRFNFSWYTLIEKSNINKDLFNSHYNHASNYAHSEFHSIAQIRELEFYNNKINYDAFTYPIIQMINVVCSKLFLMMFDYYSLNDKVELNDKYDINLIRFYSLVFSKPTQ